MYVFLGGGLFPFAGIKMDCCIDSWCFSVELSPPSLIRLITNDNFRIMAQPVC